jgi:signal peptidase II
MQSLARRWRGDTMAEVRSARGLPMGLAVALAVLLADQATKWWVQEAFAAPPRIVEVTPFFNLLLTWNRGVSFGLFGSDSALGPILLVALACGITLWLLIWLARAERNHLAAALGLIIGGALGNVVCRLRFGAVTDFIDLHAAGYHWPAFNLADSAIAVGVAILLLDWLLARGESSK